MSQKGLLYLTTFVANAAILVFEIAGARLLAPYLGTSVEVWSGTIAVILGGMALGYTLGGVFADKTPTRQALSTVVFASGITACVAWGLRDIIPALFLAVHGLPLTFSAMLTAILLFAPTTILLASVSPFIAKFLLTTLDSSAKTIGNINAIGTIGSIAGAILSGAVLIPLFGLGNIFLGIALVLLSLSLVLSTSNLSRKGVLMLLVLLLTSGTGALANVGAGGSVLIDDIATPYNRIWVFDREYEGETVRVIRTDPFGTQCGMYVNADGTLNETDLAFPYTKAFDAFARSEFANETPKTLFLGGCNYSFPRAFLHSFPEALATVVELDPGMTKAAKKYFNFIPEHFPTLSIIHEDARIFLNNNTAPFDLVFMDVFGSFSNTPPHLTTKEAFEALARSMTPTGVLLVNIIATQSGDASVFPASLYETIATAFPKVAIYANDNYYEDVPQNLLLVASLTRTLPEHIVNSKLRAGLSVMNLSKLDPGIVLTDDYAPVEFMTRTLRESKL